jgi:dipeptidyl aminopeptidase/acylaminoacyl peptidase
MSRMKILYRLKMGSHPFSFANLRIFRFCRINVRTALLLVVLGMSFCLYARSIAHAQQAGPLRVEDVVRADSFGRLMPIAVSPDGKSVAFAVQAKQRRAAVNLEIYVRSGVPPWASGTDIYILSLAGGGARNLTGGKGNNWLPVWSHDGHYLAFLSDRDGDRADLWIWDSAKDLLKKISNIEVHSDQIQWTADDRRILVTVKPQDWVEDLGRKRSLTTQRTGSVIERVGDSTASIYRSVETSSERPEALQSDPWNLNMVRRDLVSIDIQTGQVAALVHGRRISTYVLSADGSRIAYTIPNRFEKPGSQQIVFDLAVADSLGGGQKTIASDVRMDYDGSSLSWSPDGERLSFRTGGTAETKYDCYVADGKETGSRNLTRFHNAGQASLHNSGRPLWGATGDRVYFIHDGALWRAFVGSGDAQEVGHIPNRQITYMIQSSENQLWTPDGGKSTVVATRDSLGKQDGFYSIDLVTGESHELLERGECYTCANVAEKFSVTRDGHHVVYFAESAGQDEALWIAPSTFESPHQLTHLNPQFAEYRMGNARLIDWLSDDGERLHGALLLPPDYQENQRYPLVVWVYGGALLSDHFDHFGLGYSGPFNLQLLATRGYVVLLPDAPLHAGSPMLDLVKTVLPGVNKVIELGIANPHQVGVVGHSYGGYSVLALIVQTARFKAAIEMDGYANLVGHYGEMAPDGTAFGTSIEEHGQGLMGGPPWEYPIRYLENSPVFHFDRIETPLLIVHGGRDDDIRPFLGEEIFVGLRRLGKSVEFAKYEGEGHSPTDWSFANQVDLSNRVISWFDAHLKKHSKN